MGEAGEAGRLVSSSGASFGLVPVPGVVRASGRLLVDVELVDDGTLVCYLGRRVRPAALATLADAYRRAATDAHPERTVEPVDLPGAGARVAFVASDTLTVTVRCSVARNLDDADPELDVRTLRIVRTVLATAARELAWLVGPTPDTTAS